MDTTPSAIRDTQPRAAGRRRWLRFSLRTFLIVCTLLALAFGWLGSILVRVRHQRAIVAQIEAAGGRVHYDYEVQWDMVDGEPQRKPPPGPKIIRMLVGDDAFAHAEQVRFLDERITEDRLACLTELPHLKSVEIHNWELALYQALNGQAWSGPDLSDEALGNLGQIPRLERLVLVANQVSPKGLSQLANAKDLRELSLGGPAIDNETIRPIDRLQSLTSLELFRTKVTSEGLAPIGRLTNLEQLDFNQTTGVHDPGLESLRPLTKLRMLRLSNTCVTDAGLVHLRGLPRVESLDLSNCDLTDLGVQQIVAHSKLKSLDLASTRISDKGVGALTHFEALEHLNLGGTDITDESTVYLAEMNQLKQLNLLSTLITDEGLQRLQSLTELESLTVGPYVTSDAVNQLKTFLPGCRIEVWHGTH